MRERIINTNRDFYKAMLDGFIVTDLMKCNQYKMFPCGTVKSRGLSSPIERDHGAGKWTRWMPIGICCTHPATARKVKS